MEEKYEFWTNDKLAVFRAHAISQCIVCDSIEDISNITKE